MSSLVTLNIYSGRPDPTWVLDSEQTQELLERVDGIATESNLKPGVIPRLGYNGFTVFGPSSFSNQPVTLRIEGGVVNLGENSPSRVESEREIEAWLLQTAGDGIGSEAYQHALNEIAKPVTDQAVLRGAGRAKCPPNVTDDAPPYNPGMWNVPGILENNNCYNYANDKITNTFAQPGRASGNLWVPPPTCAGVQASAQSDGLVPSPNFSGPLGPGKGWYVALVIWPEEDYHWYRQDDNGCWSHKAGETPATNLDNAGQLITDPQTADRGPYINFCTYMITSRSVDIG